MPKRAKVPSHLSEESAKWFRAVLAEYELGEHHLRILQAACESWDRCQEARRVLAEQGLTYLDRFGAPRGRPEIAVERDNRLAFLRAVRELGLDLEQPTTPRPVPIGG